MENGGTERSDVYSFSYGKGNENHHLGTGFLVHKRIISRVKRVEFVSDNMCYIKRRGRWGDITVLNSNASAEHKRDDSKECFLDELEQVVYHFPK